MVGPAQPSGRSPCAGGAPEASFPPDAAVAPSAITPGKRSSVRRPASSTIFARSASVSPDSRRYTIAAGASSPPWSSSDASSALVDSASPGRKEVDSFSSASVNFPGRLSGPAAMKMPTNQIVNTTHFARELVAIVKTERR